MEQTNEIKELIKNVANVQNMTSNKGNTIPNQFIIKTDKYTLFQSYNSPIAMLKDGKVYLFKDWNYSRTTTKYRNDFLGENTATTLKKLKEGVYIAVDFEV